MRLARGNQAPLEFSSRTTISLSYALLSVCIGASATPKRLAGRRFQRFGARRGRRVDARGAVNRWRGHVLPLGPSGSGFRGRRATDLVGEDLFDGDALASNRREFHSTVWCCDDGPETFGEAYDLLSTHDRRYGTVYVPFDCISSLRNRPCWAPPLKWVLSGTTASPRDARMGVQRARAPSPTQTRPGWPGDARGGAVMTASMSKTLASTCSISSPATKVLFCIHSATDLVWMVLPPRPENLVGITSYFSL